MSLTSIWKDQIEYVPLTLETIANSYPHNSLLLLTLRDVHFALTDL
jgi:hypothetical protein